ncbi:hypothetical protein K0A19_18355, partial [Salmonella enterica subsp. enterica serovar Montevideo]|nr:hypothetical protein [Salmonella enterica subsp. enterica serovar Montevideo]
DSFQLSHTLKSIVAIDRLILENAVSYSEFDDYLVIWGIQSFASACKALHVFRRWGECECRSMG